VNTAELTPVLTGLMSEIVHGAPTDAAFVLNRGDAGLLASLDKLDATAASTSSHGGATIAAHVNHVTFGISLLNRWASGEENPWATADWKAAWQTTKVSTDEWDQLRRRIKQECEQWLAVLKDPRDVNDLELSGIIGNIVHLAYHLGAMRQIDSNLRGPKA
jgi:hypothetical protein